MVGEASIDLRSSGRLYQSADGRSWRALELPDVFGRGDRTGVVAPSPDDIASRDGFVVVTGDAGFLPKVWTSPDLERWDEIDLPELDRPGSTNQLAVAAGGPGFVVVGGGGWFSSDGKTWEAIELSADEGLFAAEVAYVGHQFVAVGSSAAGPVAWRSADGRRWEQVTLGTDDEFATTVTGRDGVLVAAGLRFGPGGEVRPVVWRSVDGGLTWAVVELGDAGHGQRYADVVVVDGDEFVLLAHDETAAGPANVEYRSADGLTWRVAPIALPGTRTDAVAFDGGIVAIGQRGSLFMPNEDDETRGPVAPAAPSTDDGTVWIHAS